MTTPLSTTPGADLPSPFGWGRGSLNDSFWYTGWLLTFLAAGDQTQGRFALIDALARKDNCPPRHIHRNEDESFYILEGEITAWIGDQTIRGTAGTLIFSPRGVPHSFEIHSDEIHSDRVRMPILLTPAGLEGYFKQFCTPAPALILPPPCRSSIRGRYKPKFCGRFYLQRSR
jgi:mannose-6-phosphate isomerase-like protein (cupin superfamily)